MSKTHRPSFEAQQSTDPSRSQTHDGVNSKTPDRRDSVVQMMQTRRSSGLTGAMLMAHIERHSPLHMKGQPHHSAGLSSIHAAAQHGVRGAGQRLPHVDTIQQSFGSHDITAVQAHVGGDAAKASAAIGARAYATGNHVAFASSPDLHTAAHEAAHVVQQRAGVQLKGGLGQIGDRYEQHADRVADLVVQGKSAQALLDPYAGKTQAVGHGPVQQLQLDADSAAPQQASPQTETTPSNAETAASDHASDDAVACPWLEGVEAGATSSVPVSFDKKIELNMNGVEPSPSIHLALSGNVQTSPEIAFKGSGALTFDSPGFHKKIELNENGFNMAEFGLTINIGSLKASLGSRMSRNSETGEIDMDMLELGLGKDGVAGGHLRFHVSGSQPSQVQPILTCWFDVLGTLFGGALEELNAHLSAWEPGANPEESNFEAMQRLKGIKVDLSTKFTFVVELGTGEGPRLEHAKMELGASILGGSGEDGVAVGAGLEASIETDYATGAEGDRNDVTQGTSKAFLILQVGGLSWKPEWSHDAESVGTWLQKYEAHEDLASTCLSAAYQHTRAQRSQYITQGNNAQPTAVRLLHEAFATFYMQACDEIEAQEQQKLKRYFNTIAIYELIGGARGDLTNYHFTSTGNTLGAQVIQSNEAARVVHEDIVFEGGVTIEGAYTATWGEQVSTVTFRREGEGDTWEATWPGGILWARLSTNVLHIDWHEDDREGSSVLQVQDYGRRLIGNRTVGSKTEAWLFEKA